MGQPFPEDRQKQIIYRLITQLQYYITAPIREFHTALPQIEALEKECQDLDEMQGKPKINYIIEILAALHEQVKDERSGDNLRNDEESLLSKVVMSFKEKIVRIKAAGKSIYALVGYKRIA